MTLTKLDDFTSQLSELDKIIDICNKLMTMPHYKKLGVEGIHAIIARAKSLNIHPFEALNGGFYCIQGKVGMSTEMMTALVRRRGHSITMIESNNTSCTLKGKRNDNGDEWTCTFSDKDAITAGLWNGPTWKKYPKVMLYNRCMSMLFRQLFPDISLGIGYEKDELHEITESGDYSDMPVAEVENLPSIVYPNGFEVDELEGILTKCPKEYVQKILEGIAARGWKTFGQMDIKSFESLKAAALLKSNVEAAVEEVTE